MMWKGYLGLTVTIHEIQMFIDGLLNTLVTRQQYHPYPRPLPPLMTNSPPL